MTDLALKMAQEPLAWSDLWYDRTAEMTITLTPELEKLVNEKVERGAYDSAEAFVGEAVQRSIEEEREEDAHLDEIRTQVDAADAEIDRGEYGEYDENTTVELARDVRQRGLKKLDAQRAKTGNGG